MAVYPNSYLPRVKTLLLLACSLVLALAPAGNVAAASAPGKPLRVVLVSGAESYNSDQAFADLAAYLQREYGMSCEVLRMSADQTQIVGIEKLLEADTAVFHVRRKTLTPEHLAILKKFFASGKGFVGLRSTSHGWENWKDFDQQILGAKYGGPGGGNFGIATRLMLKPHPIWAGVEGLETKKDLYRITEVGSDVDVIIEGETKNGKVPVGWTRAHGSQKLFYLALAYQAEMEHPAFRRAIGNALLWVTGRPPLKQEKK